MTCDPHLVDQGTPLDSAASVQWRVQEGHLQDELRQMNKDKEDAQKHCSDLQRRHAQAQHEIRRKVQPSCRLDHDSIARM